MVDANAKSVACLIPLHVLVFDTSFGMKCDLYHFSLAVFFRRRFFLMLLLRTRGLLVATAIRQFVFSHETMKIKRRTYRPSVYMLCGHTNARSTCFLSLRLDIALFIRSLNFKAANVLYLRVAPRTDDNLNTHVHTTMRVWLSVVYVVRV